jgi:glycosyltransferase involved in cell wall biosynthesis
MATYNGGAHLRAQLDSIAGQTLLPAELQIGDDGSTDDTEAIVADFAGSAPFPVVFHRNRPRLGYGSNFLEAARRCSGDWIAFSDQDDVWLPDKLQACAEALERAADREILMIAHSARIVGSDLTPTGGRIPADLRDEVRGRLGHPLTWSHYGFAQLFRRELVADLPLSPRVPTLFTNIDPYPHDVWISALANILGASLHLVRDLCLYRRHDASLTETAKTQRVAPLAAARATGAGHYRHVAAVCREAADALDTQAGAAKPDWRGKLEAGADAYRRLADALCVRARVYEGGLGGRLGAVARLAAGPGYFGLGASSFGARALAKDLAAAAAPSLFRETRR